MNIITKLRQEMQLTQGELANKLGYSRTLINKWENGAAKPTPEQVTFLATFFKIDKFFFENIKLKKVSIQKQEKIYLLKNKLVKVAIIESLFYLIGALILIIIYSQKQILILLYITIALLTIATLGIIFGLVVHFLSDKKNQDDTFYELQYLKTKLSKSDYEIIKTKTPHQIELRFLKEIAKQIK